MQGELSVVGTIMGAFPLLSCAPHDLPYPPNETVKAGLAQNNLIKVIWVDNIMFNSFDTSDIAQISQIS